MLEGEESQRHCQAERGQSQIGQESSPAGLLHEARRCDGSRSPAKTIDGQGDRHGEQQARFQRTFTTEAPLGGQGQSHGQKAAQQMGKPAANLMRQ